MGNNLTIRPAQDADVPALAGLLNEIIARGGTTAYERPFTTDDFANAMLTGPEVICSFVADDRVSGLVGFQAVVRSAYVSKDVGDIATFSRIGWVQQGIGSLLFAATREAAAAKALSAINATIRADNVGGLAFYTRLGFTNHSIHRAIPLSNGTPVDRINKRFALTVSG